MKITALLNLTPDQITFYNELSKHAPALEWQQEKLPTAWDAWLPPGQRAATSFP